MAFAVSLACAAPARPRTDAAQREDGGAFRKVRTYENEAAQSPDGQFSIVFAGVAHQLATGELGIEGAELAFVLEDPEIAMAAYRFGRPDLDLDDAVHFRRGLVEDGDIEFVSERRTFLPGSRYRVASVSRFVDRKAVPPIWYCSVIARGPADLYEVITWSGAAGSAEPVCAAAFGLRLAPE